MPEAQSTDTEFQAIAFCPVCCTNIDVEGAGRQELQCGSCGQEFSMDVDPERFAQHSIH
jgi:transcription elongation factor Elf1